VELWISKINIGFILSASKDICCGSEILILRQKKIRYMWTCG